MSTITKRLSVAQYEAMIENGILPESNRWELINGKLVEKVTKGGKHSASSGRTWRAIHGLVPAGWHVRIETPIRIPTRRSEPEPDVSVACGGIDDYEDRNADAADIALVVEVAESSVAKDRRLARVYGGGGIPVYWIVNLRDRQVEVYAHPIAGEYSAAISIGEGESVEVVIDGQAVGTIAVADLLPRAKEGGDA